jgi:hypothetical protein
MHFGYMVGSSILKWGRFNLDRGRRIFWDSATGTILLDTCESSGDVNAHPEVVGNVMVLDLPYGQDKDKFNSGSTRHIDIGTSVVIFDESIPAVLTPEQIIEDLENQLLIALGVI